MADMGRAIRIGNGRRDVEFLVGHTEPSSERLLRLRCPTHGLGQFLEHRQHERPSVEVVSVDLRRRARDVLTSLHKGRKTSRACRGISLKLAGRPSGYGVE